MVIFVMKLSCVRYDYYDFTIKYFKKNVIICHLTLFFCEEFKHWLDSKKIRSSKKNH